MITKLNKLAWTDGGDYTSGTSYDTLTYVKYNEEIWLNSVAGNTKTPSESNGWKKIGVRGPKGDAYTLTEEDRKVIAEMSGGYGKPEAGIPKSDLEQDVINSLGKADTALQPDSIADMETKTHASATYQPKGNYLTQHQSLAGLQSTISDLENIRSGASKGATALQPVSGKGLSSNDYTTEDKNKLAGLNNYNDSEVRGLISSLQSAIDALTGTENTTETIDTMNEIMEFLNAYKNTDNLASVLSTLKSTIEQWVENKKYLTEHQSLAGYATESFVNEKVGNIESALTSLHTLLASI